MAPVVVPENPRGHVRPGGSRDEIVTITVESRGKCSRAVNRIAGRRVWQVVRYNESGPIVVLREPLGKPGG